MSYEFNPNYAVAPGETLKDILKQQKMSYEDLSTKTNFSCGLIKQIVEGKVPITIEIANKLEEVLKFPARIWLSLEANFCKYNK